MKKILSFILAVIIGCSVFSVAGFAAETEKISAFSVEIVTEEDSAADLVVDWYKNGNKYYLFIPSSIDLEKAVISFSSSADVYCGETKLTSGDSAAFLKDKQQITLICGEENHDVIILAESKVSSVFIETESGSLDAIHADKEHKEKGKITIINTNGETECAGALDYIKGRGNSTWGMAKKPYNIKLEDKENLFGMGKSKKWSLIANYQDASLARNALAYTAAQNAGMAYSPDFEPVDVYINGSYEGAYLLTTRVEVDGSRVDIEDLEKANEKANPDIEDFENCARGGTYGTFSGYLEGTRKWVEIPNNPADITGGYLLECELPARYCDEISGFVTEGSHAIVVKSPEYASEAQVNYIADYYQKFENAVVSENSLSKISEYADVNSFAMLYLFNEWVANHDACITSTYMYKPANGKLFAGPVWDFDSAFGNVSVKRFGLDYTNPEGWTACHSRLYAITYIGAGNTTNVPTFFNNLAKKQEFADLSKSLWDSTMKKAAADAVNYIQNEYASNVEGSAVANAIRWKHFSTTNVDEIKAAYRNEIKEVTDFANAKSAFISSGIGTVVPVHSEKTTWDNIKDTFNIIVNDILEKALVLFNLENVI